MVFRLLYRLGKAPHLRSLLYSGLRVDEVGEEKAFFKSWSKNGTSCTLSKFGLKGTDMYIQLTMSNFYVCPLESSTITLISALQCAHFKSTKVITKIIPLKYLFLGEHCVFRLQEAAFF